MLSERDRAVAMAALAVIREEGFAIAEALLEVPEPFPEDAKQHRRGQGCGARAIAWRVKQWGWWPEEVFLPRVAAVLAGERKTETGELLPECEAPECPGGGP